MAPLEEVTTSSLDALKLYAEAGTFMDLGEYEQAIDLLTQAVELDPEFSMAWRGIAISLGNMGLDRAREHDALERAYANRDRLTERERNLTIAHYNYTVTDDLDEVVRAYERILDRNPDDIAALNNLSIVYNIDRFEPAKAEELLTRAVNGPAESYSAHFNLVVSLFNQGKFEEADAALARWMERFPTSADHYFHRTSLAAHRYDFEQAMEIQDSAVAAYPGLEQGVYMSYNLKGAFEMGMGRISRAEELWRDGFRRAQDRDRPDWAFRYARNLANLEMWFRDRPEQALVELARFDDAFPLEGMPALNRPYFGMVGSWSRAGDPERARQLLDEQEEALPAAEQSTQHRNRLLTARANIVFAEGDAARAADLYTEYRRIETCGACFLELLGEAQTELEEYEAAIESYETWLTNPVFSNFQFRSQYIPVVLERLARLYEEIGDSARAADYYEQFAAYWADPEPELQTAVETARSRAASLRASISD
jgi:tetratricopeptide (TPR) repeat protein